MKMLTPVSGGGRQNRVSRLKAALALTLIASFGLRSQAQTADNAGLKTPAGFSATVIAGNLGGAWHLDITPEGNIYLRLGKLKDGNGTLYLKQLGGKATVDKAFGDYFGTGVKIDRRDGQLAAELPRASENLAFCFLAAPMR